MRRASLPPTASGRGPGQRSRPPVPEPPVSSRNNTLNGAALGDHLAEGARRTLESMHVFEAAQDFERVVFASDPAAGLRTIIAIHSTKLGPAVGGCRIHASAIKSCLHHVFRDTALSGRRVAIQGAGKVGYSLAGLLSGEGAEVVVADTDVDNLGRAVRDYGVDAVPPARILESECDVLAPC